MSITTKKERDQFRRTPAWQLFRRFICASRNMTCEFCGVKYKRMCDLNIHHMYTTNYDNLAQDRFLLLCKTCHEFIHTKYRSPLLVDRLLFGRVDNDALTSTVVKESEVVDDNTKKCI